MSGARRLARALEASARDWGCTVRVRCDGERPWSAATYVGARHELVAMGAPAERFASWLAGLGDHLAVPGHVVAEITATPAGRIAALMLDA